MTFERAKDLGATHIALVLTWYVPDGRHGAPSSHPQKSPELGEIERTVMRLRALGLQVMLKPHVDRLDGGSRTEIKPKSKTVWWEAYREYLLAVAEVGQRTGADAIAVGTELTRLSADTKAWRRLIADIRGRCQAKLTYAANWDEVDGIEFFDDLDWVGVDGYYPGATTDSSTAFDHLLAWQVHIARLRRIDVIRQKGLVMTELGAPSSDPQHQARVYAAALRALRHEGGILFWNLWEGEKGGTHVSMEPALVAVSLAWQSSQHSSVVRALPSPSKNASRGPLGN